jgi:hypothetical protein
MILSARRTTIEGNVLDLPRWIRAPAYINQGQTVYITLDPEALLNRPLQGAEGTGTLNTGFLELVISLFPPEIWGDLWRLKMETYDRPGNLNRIFEILCRRQIEVLMSEGSTNSNGQRHEMTFILAAHGYKSESDPKDSDARATRPTTSLQDLQDELIIELMDVLTLYPDGRPKVNVRRIQTYHSLFERFTSNKIPRPVEAKVLEKGHVVLPAPLSRDIRKRLHQRPGSRIDYSPAVDTTNRIVRLMCFANSERSPCYAQIIVPRHSNMVATIFKEIADPRASSDVKINVVRYQLRPGLGGNLRRGRRFVDQEKFMRMDLTFVPMEPGSSGEIFTRLEERLKRIPNFTMSGCFMSRAEAAIEKGKANVLKGPAKARVHATQGASTHKPARPQRRQ